jgi:hypothetical protein
MLTVESLDRLAACGCALQHRHGADCMGDGVFFLHSGCHIDVPLLVSYADGGNALDCRCLKCGRAVAAVALAGITGDHLSPLHCQVCAGDSPEDAFAWPSYRHGSGTLCLHCPVCEGVTAELPVAAEESRRAVP